MDWTGGLDWWTGLVNWTGGLDWWTGLVDWTGGLDWWTDIKNLFLMRLTRLKGCMMHDITTQNSFFLGQTDFYVNF